MQLPQFAALERLHLWTRSTGSRSQSELDLESELKLNAGDFWQLALGGGKSSRGGESAGEGGKLWAAR